MTGGWQRLHPLSPVIQGGLFFIIIVGVIFANLRDRLIWLIIPGFAADSDFEETGDPIDFILQNHLVVWAILTVVLVTGLVVLLTWLSWRFHTFRISDDAVENRKGLLFRSHRRAPLDRIQSVNLQRPMLARVFGLTRIDVLTAGQDGRVELAYLGQERAKEVRAEILRQVAAQTGAITPASTQVAAMNYQDELNKRLEGFVDEDLSYEALKGIGLVRVPTARLMASAFLSTEFIILIFALVLLPIIAIFSSWEILLGFIPGIIAIVSIAFSRFNRGFRFAISREGDAVRTGSGLTATMTETIPLRRIHAIDVMQPVWWRPFGWWRLRITTAGASRPSGQNNQNMFQNVILPVGTREDVEQVLALIEAPALAEITPDYTGAAAKAWPLLLFGVKNAAVAVGNGAIHIKRGFFTRHEIYTPLERAQSVSLTRPALHYLLGLATLQVQTVMGPVSVYVRGIEAQRAREVFDELSREMLAAQAAR